MRGHFSFREHLKDSFLQTKVGFVGGKTPNALDFRVEGIWLNDCLWTEPSRVHARAFRNRGHLDELGQGISENHATLKALWQWLHSY